MAENSKIEWTESTWNPIAGCSVLTPGCINCYAMKMAARLDAMNQELYAGLTQPSKAGPVWTGKVRLAPDSVLLRPIKRKKPTTYFVNSMSDLFHEGVPDEWIDKVFAVMALTPRHTFQVLTKRAKRMREYVAGLPERRAMLACHSGLDWVDWPLPNVWLGVSAERQQEADERIPHLLQTPAAVRFISAEPLLGPIDLTSIRAPDYNADGLWTFSALSVGDYYTEHDRFGRTTGTDGPHREHKVDWVIAGGESGSNARPMHPDWARSLRDQCDAAGIPFFMKQMTGKKPIPDDLMVREFPVRG